MGKQNKGWTPPEDAVETAVQETPAPSPNAEWTPPADAVVSESVKKKESSDPSASSKDSNIPGAPSGKSTTNIQLNENQRKTLAKNTKPKTQQDIAFDKSQEKGAREFVTGEKNSEDVLTSLGKTIQSGVVDQLPKEYYSQRLRMSKGSFGDLYDKRSDINAFGGDEFHNKMPKGTSIDAFMSWNNKQSSEIRHKSYDERSKLFLIEKIGLKEFDKLKAQFAVDNVDQRIGFEKNIEQQNFESGEKLEGVVQNLSEVNGAGDFLSFVGNMLGQAIYRAPVSILTGPTGSIISESASVYDRQIDLIAQDKGISRQDVIKQGLDKPAEGQAAAVLAGTLDSVSEFNLLGLFKKAVGKEIKQSVAKQFVKGFVRGGVPESVTEVIQGELEEAAASKGAGVDYTVDSWRIATSAIGGLIGGGLIGGATNIKLTPSQESETAHDVIKDVSSGLQSTDITSIEKAADIIDAKVKQTEENPVVKTEAVVPDVIMTDLTPTTDETQDTKVQTEPETGITGGREYVQENQTQEELPVQTEGKSEEQVIVETGKKKTAVTVVTEEGGKQLFTINEQLTKKEISKEEAKVQIDKLVQSNDLKYAIQESKSEEVLQQEQRGTGSEGGERGGMEPIQQGEGVATEGQKEEEVAEDDQVQESGQIPEENSVQQQEQVTADGESQQQNETTPTEVSGAGEATTSVQGDIPENQSQQVQTEPAGTTEPQQQAEQASDRENRKFSEKILNDPNISDEIKQGLSQDAKTYIPKSMSITNGEAQAIINTKGSEAAMADYMDRSNEMTNDVRVTLGENLLRKFTADKDVTNAIKIADNLSQYFTDLGRAVNAAKIFQMLSPEGVFKYVTKEITKSKAEYSKRTSGRRKKTKEAIDDINKEAVNKILSDPKVRNKIISETKKGSIKKAIDFLEGLKVDTKGKALDAVYGLTAAAWNTVITAVQKGLKAGLTITQAINKAINNGRKDVNFDEKGAREYLDEKLKEYRVTLDPAKAIKEELKSQNEKIDNIIRQHYTEVDVKKRTLIDKLVKDANLNPDQAETISKDLAAEFDKLTREAKEKALKKYLPKPDRSRTKVNKKELVDQIIEDSNLGVITDDSYRDIISDKIGVESLTDEQAKKLNDLAVKVQDAKEGFDKDNATERMMNHIASIKGIDWMDVGMSIWYANILSGLSTQILNISANFAETVGEVYTAAVLNPKETGWIMKGLFSGWGRGALESMAALKSGYQPTKSQNKIDASSALERVNFKGGKWNPYNYLKYVSRVMNAADIFFYHGINEMRARELAVSTAKKENKSQPTREIIKKATEILYKGENPYTESLERAKTEGFEGADARRRAYEILEQQRPEFVIKDSNDEAARGTFNYDPEGTLGALTAGINQMINKVDIKGVKPLKFVIPFTRIIANVTNRYLDWTPVGLLRWAKGGIGYTSLGENYHKKYTDQEKAEVLIRALSGIAAMIAMYALTDDEDGIFEITSNGTGDVQKNFELQETGWRPYSIKINGTWYEYKNTPLAIPFATIGFLRDAEKYQGQKDMEARASIVLFGTMKYVMDLSFLQSASAFMDTFSKENRGGAENFFKKTTKSVESTAKSFVVPNAFTQASRSMQEVMDLPIKKANGIGHQIIRDMPILRDNLGNIYDALGDPVTPKQIERFVPLKPSSADADKLWDLIVENNAWIGRPRRSTQKPNGDSLTDDEYDKFSLLSGQLTKKNLQMNYRVLSRLKDKETVKDEIDNIKTESRREAREILFGF